MTRRCRDCGNSFRGESWKSRCTTCYIEMKRHEERGDELADAYRKGYVDRLTSSWPEFDGGFLRDVIVLCHSARFELANRVTATLVEIRDQLRSAA